MGTPESTEMLNSVESGDFPTEENEFPCKGDDPFEELDQKAKQLLKTCHGHYLDFFNTLLDKGLEEGTLKKRDKNKMNVFHLLLYEKQTRVWNTKDLDSESRAKVVAIIKGICQKFPNRVTDQLMEQQDSNGRTPLHYAAFIDINDEKEDSNITLALLINGGDRALFVEDKNGEAPVSFISTSNLKTLLDTKQRIEGPVGHKDCVAHVDVSNFQSPRGKKKYTSRFEYLQKLAGKHKDLFDHLVITAIIW